MNAPTSTPNPTPNAETELRVRAEKRVNMKMGFYTHAMVFVLVNLGMYLFTQVSGRGHWGMFPLWGWGLGLAIHGLVTFLTLNGEGFRERMLADEEDRLRQRR